MRTSLSRLASGDITGIVRAIVPETALPMTRAVAIRAVLCIPPGQITPTGPGGLVVVVVRGQVEKKEKEEERGCPPPPPPRPFFSASPSTNYEFRNCNGPPMGRGVGIPDTPTQTPRNDTRDVIGDVEVRILQKKKNPQSRSAPHFVGHHQTSDCGWQLAVGGGWRLAVLGGCPWGRPEREKNWAS